MKSYCRVQETFWLATLSERSVTLKDFFENKNCIHLQGIAKHKCHNGRGNKKKNLPDLFFMS